MFEPNLGDIDAEILLCGDSPMFTVFTLFIFMLLYCLHCILYLESIHLSSEDLESAHHV